MTHRFFLFHLLQNWYKNLFHICYLGTTTIATATITTCLVGCETLNDWFSSDKVDYQSAAVGPSLVVPADLTSPPTGHHFTVPAKPIPTLLSNPYSQSQSADAGTGTATQQYRMQSMLQNLRIERNGNRYWLIVSSYSAEQLWPLLQAFWQQNGFVLAIDQPKIGVMETDWAENRAKIPNDWFRKSIGKLLEGLYSSGTRDKFRTLVERRPQQTIVISITHYGMEEVLTGRDKESSRWQDRARDPKLELTFLQRLMEKFGLTAEQAQQLITNAH